MRSCPQFVRASELVDECRNALQLGALIRHEVIGAQL